MIHKHQTKHTWYTSIKQNIHDTQASNKTHMIHKHQTKHTWYTSIKQNIHDTQASNKTYMIHKHQTKHTWYTSIKQNIHDTQASNTIFWRASELSPLSITPLKRAHMARTCWYCWPICLIYWYHLKKNIEEKKEEKKKEKKGGGGGGVDIKNIGKNQKIIKMHHGKERNTSAIYMAASCT